MSRKKQLEAAYWARQEEDALRRSFVQFLEARNLPRDDVSAETFARSLTQEGRGGRDVRDTIEFLCGTVPHLFD